MPYTRRDEGQLSTQPEAVGSRHRPRVGVLALQGSVEPHLHALERLGHDPVEVRRPEQLEGLTHLIIPGGESTTVVKLLELYGLWDPIEGRGRAGDLAIFGTCAGAIVLGREHEVRPERMGLIDITVDRNAYGRQIDSFVSAIEVDPSIDDGTFEGVFIRAPKFSDPGPDVEVWGKLDGEPVLARQGRMLAATFHPELGRSTAIHERFLEL